jgi:hypothetical protein
MAPESVHFRVRHDTPLGAFTAQRPGVALTVWCNWEFDVYELSGATRADADALAATMGMHEGDAEIHELDGALHVIVGLCSNTPHGSAVEHIDESRCLHVPPARIHAGWEEFKMVSFSEERTRDVFARLRKEGAEVELVAKKPLNRQALLATEGPGLGSLFDALTDKQAEAVVLANRHGLYASPRRTTAAAIADSVGLSRSTFEEHLRKAENTLLGGMAPHLELNVRVRAARKAQAPVAGN